MTTGITFKHSIPDVRNLVHDTKFAGGTLEAFFKKWAQVEVDWNFVSSISDGADQLETSNLDGLNDKDYQKLWNMVTFFQQEGFLKQAASRESLVHPKRLQTLRLTNMALDKIIQWDERVPQTFEFPQYTLATNLNERKNMVSKALGIGSLYRDSRATPVDPRLAAMAEENNALWLGRAFSKRVKTCDVSPSPLQETPSACVPIALSAQIDTSVAKTLISSMSESSEVLHSIFTTTQSQEEVQSITNECTDLREVAQRVKDLAMTTLVRKQGEALQEKEISLAKHKASLMDVELHSEERDILETLQRVQIKIAENRQRQFENRVREYNGYLTALLNTSDEALISEIKRIVPNSAIKKEVTPQVHVAVPQVAPDENLCPVPNRLNELKYIGAEVLLNLCKSPDCSIKLGDVLDLLQTIGIDSHQEEHIQSFFQDLIKMTKDSGVNPWTYTDPKWSGLTQQDRITQRQEYIRNFKFKKDHLKLFLKFFAPTGNLYDIHRFISEIYGLESFHRTLTREDALTLLRIKFRTEPEGKRGQFLFRFSGSSFSDGKLVLDALRLDERENFSVLVYFDTERGGWIMGDGKNAQSKVYPTLKSIGEFHKNAIDTPIKYVK